MTRVDCAGAEPALLQTHVPRVSTSTPMSVCVPRPQSPTLRHHGYTGKAVVQTCHLCTEPNAVLAVPQVNRALLQAGQLPTEQAAQLGGTCLPIACLSSSLPAEHAAALITDPAAIGFAKCCIVSAASSIKHRALVQLGHSDNSVPSQVDT